MRWRLVVYKNTNPYPISASADEATPTIVERGVVSLSITRSKNNPEGMTNVTMVGKLDPAIFHGNWVIIRSKVGDFTKSTGEGGGILSQGATVNVEGIPRFIGQIDTVESTYSADPASGLVTRVHSIRIREWSHVFRQTIKFDLFDLAQQINPSAFASVTSAAAVIARGSISPDAQKNLETIAKAITNPFEYVTIALAMVSGINKGASSKAVANNGTLQNALNAAAFYSNIATRMPAIPKSLLLDMGLGSEADPERPFASDESFALVLLGNQAPGIGSNNPVSGAGLTAATAGINKALSSIGTGKSQELGVVPTFSDAPAGTFNGVFSSEKEITNSFKIPQDRPVMYGALADFSQEFDLWSLISTRCDPDINEIFTDIWYHESDGKIIGRPVLVMRDKPFLLDQVREKIGELENQWTSFDDLPKVYIPFSLIQDIKTTSTFNGAPNYNRVNVRDPIIRDDSTVVAQAQVLGRSVNNAAQTRYGGIFFSVDSPFFAQAGSNPPKSYDLDTSWYGDIGKLMQGWYGTRFYFPSGQITLKDNNIPIMVGCNIVFNVGKNATYVAHVDGVSFSHQVGGRGDRVSSTTVAFSYLSVYEDEQALIMGPESVQDLFVKSTVDLPAFGGPLGAFVSKLGGDETIREAQKAVAAARKLEKLLG